MLMDQGAPHPASVSAGQLTYKVSTCLTKCPIRSSRHLSPPRRAEPGAHRLAFLWGNAFGTQEESPPPSRCSSAALMGLPQPRSHLARLQRVEKGWGGGMSQQQWHGEREAPYPRGLSAGHERPWHTAGYPDRRSQRIALIERPTPPHPVRGTARCPFARPLVAAEARHGPVLMSPRPHSTTAGTSQSRGAGTRLAAAHGSVLAAPAVPSALRFEVLWGTRRAVPEPSLHTHGPVAGSAKGFSSDVPQKEPMDAWEVSQAKAKCHGSGLPRPYCSAPAPTSFLPHSTQPPLAHCLCFSPSHLGCTAQKEPFFQPPPPHPPSSGRSVLLLRHLRLWLSES